MILDRHDDAVQRTDQSSRRSELTILGRGRFERVRHVAARVGAVGHASRFALIESPRPPRGRAQIERRQRVQLARTRNRRDRAEDALRLAHAGAVVGLDALQVQLDETDGGDLSADDRLLEISNRRVLQMKRGPA